MTVSIRHLGGVVPLKIMHMSLSADVSKVGKILPVKGKFFSGCKKIQFFAYLLFLKFQILSNISKPHAIFGKMGGCFRQNGCMQFGACPYLGVG